MSEAEITKFLRCPYGNLVEYALSIANLSWQESLAINFCGRQKYSQERAAELAGYSVDAVHLWYRAGIKKLLIAWGAQEWIKKIIN